MTNGIFDSNVPDTPAVQATGINGANGVNASSDSGTGVLAQSSNLIGLHAVGGGATLTRTTAIAAIYAEGGPNSGVLIFNNSNLAGAIEAANTTGDGLIASSGGQGRGISGSSVQGTGIEGSSNQGTGILAQSSSGIGIHAVGGGASPSGSPSTPPPAIFGEGACPAVFGRSTNADAITGQSDIGAGVIGTSTTGRGIFAQSGQGIGLEAVGGGATPAASPPITQAAIFAEGGPGTGVFATSDTGTGVSGQLGPQGSAVAAGIFGSSLAPNSNGVIGEANNGGAAYGVWGRSTSGFAGFFSGNVSVTGTLTKSMGGFRIDHPLDPENKYLAHSFVESPDMLNVYNGNVTTDANGDAAVTLPDYFEALNQDFRYQLTVIGQFAQAIVAGEISNNQFTIKTDQPNVKVSWQVTGIRKDPVANTHRLVVEEDKSADERGTYLHPEAYGKSET